MLAPTHCIMLRSSFSTTREWQSHCLLLGMSPLYGCVGDNWPHWVAPCKLSTVGVHAISLLRLSKQTAALNYKMCFSRVCARVRACVRACVCVWYCNCGIVIAGFASHRNNMDSLNPLWVKLGRSVKVALILPMLIGRSQHNINF